MILAEAATLIEATLDGLNPHLRGRGQLSSDATALRTLHNGDRIDAILQQAGRPYVYDERAIHAALGIHCGSIMGN